MLLYRCYYCRLVVLAGGTIFRSPLGVTGHLPLDFPRHLVLLGPWILDGLVVVVVPSDLGWVPTRPLLTTRASLVVSAPWMRESLLVPQDLRPRWGCPNGLPFVPNCHLCENLERPLFQKSSWYFRLGLRYPADLSLRRRRKQVWSVT